MATYGRFVAGDRRVLAAFGFNEIEVDPVSGEATPNAKISVVRANGDLRPELVRLAWGFENPHGSSSLLFARAESVHLRLSFRNAFKYRRCVVPASGYHEWRTDEVGGRQLHFVSRKDGAPLAFAAIWQEDKVAIITTPASEDMQSIHNRMPVVLEQADVERYLDVKPLGMIERGQLLYPREGVLVSHEAGELLEKDTPCETLSPRSRLVGA